MWWDGCEAQSLWYKSQLALRGGDVMGVQSPSDARQVWYKHVGGPSRERAGRGWTTRQSAGAAAVTAGRSQGNCRDLGTTEAGSPVQALANNPHTARVSMAVVELQVVVVMLVQVVAVAVMVVVVVMLVVLALVLELELALELELELVVVVVVVLDKATSFASTVVQWLVTDRTVVSMVNWHRVVLAGDLSVRKP